MVLCGFGCHGKFMERSKQVVSMLRAANVRLHYLSMTKDGEPGHPLYLSYDLQPKEWKLWRSVTRVTPPTS